MSGPRTRAFAAVTPLPRAISLPTDTDTTVHIDVGQHLDVDTKHPLSHTGTPRTSGTS
ncbi:hypothetical protein ACIP6Q_21950 [Streptomyces bobili]|uniref:hypothetical protein n=1 Tax=Streptomyces bobili TaxID=67280 RepID=UPI0036E44CA4